ncbi:uncharacterized protein LOC110453756 [Mizuhopecten yessoensis]|uniref:E3 ubiquitin-protein ligase HECTD1 n=1 Tax=Mizuhopecten yessoensis TaxID=6573 RepID=A0A210QH07_MIZYE|nr:uncharacterized protein LOC110453756 [Mizuhopecten yessoensis]XP_021358566.1 uncharacterized protein LOC110453756 [Mizuhopecten yessoensis]OWF47911.1 E3 ubiquitin-protein ligase HECTD1 [Mizuhopecten yessoensis]
MKMGNDNSNNQRSDELHEHEADKADHISQNQGSSVDLDLSAPGGLKVNNNNHLSLSQRDKQIGSAKKEDGKKPGRSDSSELQHKEIRKGLEDIKTHTGVQQGPQTVKMDTAVQQSPCGAIAQDKEATPQFGIEANISVPVDTGAAPQFGTEANISVQADIGATPQFGTEANISVEADIGATPRFGTEANISVQADIGATPQFGTEANISVQADIGATPQFGTEANMTVPVDATILEWSDEEEPLKKSLYNGQSVFPSQDGKESWQDSDGCISNIFPVEDVSPVEHTPLEKSHTVEPLTCTSVPENKPMIEECLDMQDGRGDNHVLQDQDCNPAMTEKSSEQATKCNGLSPTVQKAYSEFQALFSYVNDLKLSNRRIMKKLTEEQQKYKKTFEDSEAKVSGLKECVTFLEERVSQREGQIKKFKGIVQVLLQKVSTLSTALGDFPGNDGRGQGFEASSSSEEGEEEDSEQKYKLPKPLTDQVKAVIPIKQQVGYRGTKATTGTDNRADCSEPPSSKVLRRAMRERTKTTMTGSSKKSAADSSNTGPKHQNSQRSHNVGKDKADQRRKDADETKKSEANVPIPKTREPKPRKTSGKQVPIQNEFRNTLREVTDMTKETSSVPRPYDMDLNSWIQEANMEIVKAAESASPRGRGPNVVLCLDISQSMEGPPFLNMVQGVLRYIDGVENMRMSLGLHINLAIVTFGHQTAVLQHLTNELSILREAVRNLTTGGTSPLAAGLLMCTAATVSPILGVTAGYVHQPRIIIFTDGRATLESRLIGEDVPLDGDFSYEVNANMMGVAEDIRKRKLSVSYVPIGNFYSRYMEQIAEMTGGKMYPMEQLDRAIRHSKNFPFAARLIPIIKKATGGHLKDENANKHILENVARNDPFITKEDEEDILEILNKEDEFEKEPESDSENDEGHRELKHDMPPLGSRVRRGPDWSWDEQDSYMAGTVVSHKSDGWLCVLWDSGHSNRYCYGQGGKYDIIPVDEPRTLKSGESIQVGCMVRRGPDWDKGNVDGGDGSMGSVIHVYPNKTLLVRWPSKEIKDHNYGCDGKFEVILCDPSEQLAHMMQATYGDGTTGGATWGATGSGENTKSSTGSEENTKSSTGSNENTKSSTGSEEKDKTKKPEQVKTDHGEKEDEDYIAKLNRLNQRNMTSSVTTPALETRLSEQSKAENMPRSGQEKPFEIMPPVAQSSSKRPHSEDSRPGSSPVGSSNQSDKLPVDPNTFPEDHRTNISGMSPTTGHSANVLDNITGFRVDSSRPGGKSDPNHHSNSGTEPGQGETLDPVPTSERNTKEAPVVMSGPEAPTDAAAAAAAGTVGKVTWQYKDEYGGWTCYSEENSNKIEKTYTKSAKGMTVINGGRHRILLAKMTQVHTTTKHMTAVRRQVK